MSRHTTSRSRCGRSRRSATDCLNRYADALGEQGRDYLARMRGAAARMRRLINDLLAFSRVTTKAEPFAPVDLGDVAREVVSDLEVRIEQTAGGSSSASCRRSRPTRCRCGSCSRT